MDTTVLKNNGSHNAADERIYSAIPVLVEYLSKEAQGKKNAIKNILIVKYIFSKTSIALTQVQVRHLINIIRKRGLIHNLIASSVGYYISSTPKEIKAYISGLRHREQEIRELREIMEAQYKDLNAILSA